MSQTPVIDLAKAARGRGDVAVHLEDRRVPSITLRMPMPQNPSHVELVRDGVDLFAVPTLLRMWAARIEQSLVQGQEVPEEILEQEDQPVHGCERTPDGVPVAEMEPV